MPEQMDLLAAELVLGLLDERDRVEALRLKATNTEFAASVAYWESLTNSWINELHDHQTSSSLADAVVTLISQRQSKSRDVAALLESETRRDGQGFWRPFAIAASFVAVLFAGLWLSSAADNRHALASRAFPDSNVPGRFSVAQIGAAKAPEIASALYDHSTGTLTVRIQGIPSDPSKVPEIWLITGANPPRSLGYGQSGATIRIQADEQLRNLFIGGATLAITLEPFAKFPHNAPSSKILGTGIVTTL